MGRYRGSQPRDHSQVGACVPAHALLEAVGVGLHLALSLPCTMPRLYTQVSSTLWILFLLVSTALVSAHMIEVPAAKKECFFEDLHVNDKVRPTLLDFETSMNMFVR